MSDETEATEASEATQVAGAPDAPDVPDVSGDAVAESPSTARRAVSVGLRLLVVVVALGISFWVLASAFDELDFREVMDAVRTLTDAELISLLAMWLLWIGAQGLLTASLIRALPVRQGVVAFLGPAAVASMVPGPSDLPIRYRMLTSWGRSTGEATLAVAAGGLFSIGIKLLLPVIAAIGLIVSDSPLDGPLRTIVAIALIVGLVLLVLGFVFGTARRTERVGNALAPVWRAVMRLLRKSQPPDLAAKMLAARSHSVQVLRDRWVIASWGTFLTATTRYALLLMALRFTGVNEDVLSWGQVFVVFALVQGLTVIPITAGDAGVSEIAYIGLLTAAAGSEYVNQITAGVLIFRVLTWLLIIPVGLVTLAAWNIDQRRRQRLVTAAGRS